MENIATLFKNEFLFQLLANHWVMTLVLVALVGLFVHFNKGLNATTRHNVWLVTLLSFLLMPLLIFAPRPDINVPKIDSSIFQNTTETVSVTPVNSIPEQTLNKSEPRSQGESLFENNSEAVPAITNTNPVSSYSEPLDTVTTEASTPAPTLSLAALLKALFVVWLTGVVFLIRRLWLEYRAARELELQSDSVTPYFQRRFEQLCARLGVAEVPPLRFHAGINAPMTVGLNRVWIAIPMVWREEIDDDVFDQTLTHELGHIARKDPMVNTLQRFLEIVLWMYPAVWYVTRQLELERESACDDWVLTHDGKSAKYASNLLDVAESLYLQPHVLAVGCLRSHSQLSRRIQNLLDKSSDHAIRNSGKLLSAVAAGLFVTLSASAVMWPDANAYLASQETRQQNENKKEGDVANLSANFDAPIDAEENGLKINGEEVEFPEGGGTVVINGVEITQTPDSKTFRAPPAPPVTFGKYVHPKKPEVVMNIGPDVIVNTGAGGNVYNTRTVENSEDGSYSYSISSKKGLGKFTINKKNNKVVAVEVEPKIEKKEYPMLHAAWNNDWLSMKRLYKEGHDINRIYPRATMPRTALNAAILQGNLDMVEFLVENGADVKADHRMTGKDEVSNAMSNAVMVGSKKIVKYLRKKGAYADDSTLLIAIQNRDVDMVRFLLDNYVEMNESALVVAVQNRDKDMVRMLLDRNDCNCLDEDSALMVAVQNRDSAMAKMLIDAGADADDGALVIAIQNRDMEMVNWLLDAGADPDDGALVMAVQNRDKKLAKRLLDAGADADDGALVIAIQNRDMQMVDWLLDAGADPDDGAVVIAVQNRNKDLVRRLVKAGADIDDGALIMAIQNRDKDMVRMLLEAGADVEDGAMIIAIQTRDNDMIRLIQDEYDKDRHGNNETDIEELRELQSQIERGSKGLGETIETIGGVASGVLGIIGDAADLEQYEYQGLALLKAMEKENVSLARSLMNDGVQPNTLHLLKALEQKETDLACEMLDKGAKPDGLSLLKALEMEDLDLARKFLNKGAQPNGLTLLKAIEIGDEKFIEEVRSKTLDNGFAAMESVYKNSNKNKNKNKVKHSNYSMHSDKDDIHVDDLIICSMQPPSTKDCHLGDMAGILQTDFSYDQWPVDFKKISVDFGDNAGQFKNKKYAPHTGIDLVASAGSEVRSIAQGVVVAATYKEGFGNMVMIDHGNGFISEYASNKKNLVKKGQQVREGQVIALVGNTAKNSAGSHLHFELNYMNNEVNPTMFLKKNKKKLLKAGS